jgi:hypothetical protein
MGYDCTFQYNATVSQTRVSRLIGRDEFVVAALRELRSDRSDAQKSGIIAMIKALRSRCINVAKMQRLEAKWAFDSAVSSIRRGKLAWRTATVNGDLYPGIQSKQIRARISWTQGAVVKKKHAKEISGVSSATRFSNVRRSSSVRTAESA